MSMKDGVFKTFHEVFPAYSNVMRLIYLTSGWPKNQNKCWNKIGSPPPAVSKNEVLKFLSVNTIVIPPANTGKDNNNNTAVITTAHPNKANLNFITKIHIFKSQKAHHIFFFIGTVAY